MKVLKFFFLLVFTFTLNFSFGQSSQTKGDYVKNSVVLLSKTLSQNGCIEKLTDEQVVRLEKILSNKAEEFMRIRTESSQKDELAVKMNNLDKLYASKIEELLSKEQRKAFRKSQKEMTIK